MNQFPGNICFNLPPQYPSKFNYLCLQNKDTQHKLANPCFFRDTPPQNSCYEDIPTAKQIHL